MSHKPKWDDKNITKNPFALLLVLAVLAYGAYSLAQTSDTQILSPGGGVERLGR